MRSILVVPHNSRFGTASLILLAFVAAAQAQNVSVSSANTGSAVDESRVVRTLYVDQANSAASDTNNGSAGAPFKTIARAAAAALVNKRAGLGTRVLIAPGVYRERVDLTAGGGETDAPIVIEAATPGTVTISGSDVWSGWAQQGAVYTKSWPYKWGLASYPQGWAGIVTLADIVRRKEMVFANGGRLTQVLNSASLSPGSFFVDEPNSRIYLSPQANRDPNADLIEVSTRSNLLYVFGLRNIVLRGLALRHEASFIQTGAALQIVNSGNVLVDKLDAQWNTSGVVVLSSDHVTIRDSAASNSAFTGIGGYRVTRSLFSGVETSFNNWRGFAGGYTDWDTAGVKFLLLHHSVIERHTARQNFSRGLWLDTDVADVLVSSGAWTGNLLDGTFIEASQGPIDVTGSVAANNSGAGLLIGNSVKLSVDRSIFYGNQGGQVAIGGQPGGRWVQDFETSQVYSSLFTTGVTLTNSTLMAAKSTQDTLVTSLPVYDWNVFMSGLRSDVNTWYSAAREDVIQIAGGVRQTLTQWQAAASQDAGSRFKNPCFTDPDGNNFTVGVCAAPRPPTLRPRGGVYSEAVLLSMTSDSPGAAIRYTMNGSSPTAASPIYTTPIQLTKSAVVTAAEFAGTVGGPAAAESYSLPGEGAQVVATPSWSYLVNCLTDGGKVVKNAGTNGAPDSGAVSVQQVSASGGYLEAVVTETGTLRWIGLGRDKAGTAPEDIAFGFALWGSVTQVREGNVVKAQATLRTGDILRVVLTNGQVDYTINGQTVYTSMNAATGGYNARVVLLSGGASVGDVRLQYAAASASSSGQAVTWTNLRNTLASGATLTKTGGSNEAPDAGAVSVQTLDGTNASLEVTLTETNTIRWFGFGGNDTGTAPEQILFGFCFWGGTVQVRESNAQRFQVSAKVGDRFTVSTSGGSVVYSQNGTPIFSSTAAIPASLKVRASLLSVGATISNAQVSTSH